MYSYLNAPASSQLAGAFAARTLLRLLPWFGPHSAEEFLPHALRQKVADKSLTGWPCIEDVLRRYAGLDT